MVFQKKSSREDSKEKDFYRIMLFWFNLVFIICLLVAWKLGLLSWEPGWFFNYTQAVMAQEKLQHFININGIMTEGSDDQNLNQDRSGYGLGQESIFNQVLNSVKIFKKNAKNESKVESIRLYQKLVDDLLQAAGLEFYTADVYGWAWIKMEEGKQESDEVKGFYNDELSRLVVHCMRYFQSDYIKNYGFAGNHADNTSNTYNYINNLTNRAERLEPKVEMTQGSGLVTATLLFNSGEQVTISAKRILVKRRETNLNTELGEEKIYLSIEGHKLNSTLDALQFRVRVTNALRVVSEKFSQDNSLNVIDMPKTALNLTSYRVHKISVIEREDIVKRMLEAAEIPSEQISGLVNDNIISITAYTSRLDEYEIVGGAPVNLQIAARYHSTDDRTYCHLGFPLLLIDY